MGIDQRHEQLNKDIKGDGGFVGLTEDEDKLNRWLICTPEIAKVVAEFESQTVLENNEHHQDFHHHEYSKTFQLQFQINVDNLKKEFEQLGNPFHVTDDCSDLIQLGTRDVMSDNVIDTVRTIQNVGSLQYQNFRKEFILNHREKFDTPIKKNKLPLFKTSNTKGQSKSKAQNEDLKLHVRLFSQMYVSTQIRGGDMDDFFKHETLKCPPALSKNGEIRSGDKADLLKGLKETSAFKESQSSMPVVNAACLDGSVIVNMTKPKKNQTFEMYCKDSFALQIKNYANAYGAER